MTRKSSLLCIVIMAALLLPASSWAGVCDQTDDEILAMMEDLNVVLEARGMDIAIEQIDCFTIGNGRPSVRIHQQPFRWVPGDVRRAALGTDITFIVDDALDPVHAPTSIGTWPSLEIRSAMATWDGERCLSNLSLIENPSSGADITLFDEGFFLPPLFCPLPGGDLPGFPPIFLGVPIGVFSADIVHAGWYPAGCFGGGTLAFSVTFIFSGGDSNGDGYLDTALNEVYYNDAFGTTIPGFPWATGAALLPAIDVETVAFHESGHSLGIGHFGPPPSAVMNPVYAGPRQSPRPIDHAGMCTIWRKWPNR